VTGEQLTVEGAVAGNEPGLAVLIVDDSPVMRNFIRRVLRMSGLAIDVLLEAGDGNAALQLLADAHVDLVLSDINMPGMDGEELIRRMESDEDLNQIPVIVVSTDSTTHRVQMMLGYGARGYIQKPFHPETLRSEVERVFEELCATADSGHRRTAGEER